MVSISLKKILYDFIFGAMVFFVTTQILTGIETPELITHWLMTFSIFALSNMLVAQTITFFTLPNNVLTNIVIGTILNFAAFYAMTLILPGISVADTTIDPISFGIVTVNPFTLSSTFTMIAAGLVSSTIYSVLNWLQYD